MSDLPFRRIVVRFDQGSRPATRSLQLIAQMARSWHLELVGVFAPDPNLSRIASHPAIREFRLLDRRWSSLEHATITSQLDSVTRQYERSFTHVLQSASVRGWFASEIDEAVEDLLVVCEPDNPLDQLGCSFCDEIGIVLASGKAVMIVPRRVVRSRGPVVVISQEKDGRLSAMGDRIASMLGERLYRIEVFPADDLRSLPGRLAAMNPRMLLVSRDILDGRADKVLFLASACRVPMLIPASEADSGAQSESDRGNTPGDPDAKP